MIFIISLQLRRNDELLRDSLRKKKTGRNVDLWDMPKNMRLEKNFSWKKVTIN